MKSPRILSFALIILPAYRKSKSGTDLSLCKICYLSWPVVIDGRYSREWTGPLKAKMVNLSPSIIKDYKVQSEIIGANPLQINCWRCMCGCISRTNRRRWSLNLRCGSAPRSISSQGYRISGIVTLWSSCSFPVANASAFPPRTCAAIPCHASPLTPYGWPSLNQEKSTCKFTETQLPSANLAVYCFVDSFQLDEPTANWAKIAMKFVAVHCWFRYN